MFKSLTNAYNAGWRAGMAKPRIVRPGGTRGIKMIITPECPLTGFLARLWWHSGWYDGTISKLK